MKKNQNIEGKLPPQRLDVEEAILGSLLIDKEAYHSISNLLVSESFYNEQNALVYRAIQTVNKKGLPIDILTVVSELRTMGQLDAVGGAYHISQLTMKVASAANVVYHAVLIKEAYIRREIIQSCHEAINNCYDDTVDFDYCVKSAELIPKKIADNMPGKIVETADKLFNQIIDKNKKILETKNRVSGVPSGFSQVDNFTGGFQNGELIILAARPAMGKTSLAIEFFKNPIFSQNISGLFFSLEMTNHMLFSRLLSQCTNIPLLDIIRNGMSEYQMQELLSKQGWFDKNKMFFDDTSGLRLEELKAKSRKLHRKHDIKFIIVDYLQLINNKQRGVNREQEVAEISRELKNLAKELNIPVIALAQLGREVEKRGGDKVPAMSDLRESGSIEQDADIVSFIHRPEYYGITEDEKGESTEGLAYLIIAKNRNGSVGKIKMRFEKTHTRFSDGGNPAHVEDMGNESITNRVAPF
jgi:replicative DNA helicase